MTTGQVVLLFLLTGIVLLIVGRELWKWDDYDD